MKLHKPTAALAPVLLAPAIFIAAILMTGCSGFQGGGSGGSSTLASEINEIMFKASLSTRAYTHQDKNTADIYLTDLSDADLTNFFENDADWSQISGSMVHVHLFLNPKPGKTPIEPTAANATVRYIIITKGQIGVYDGAGFILPSKKIGKKSLSGSFKGAPTRLTRKTPGFNDILAIARMDLSFSAKLDPVMADELKARINALASAADPIN